MFQVESMGSVGSLKQVSFVTIFIDNNLMIRLQMLQISDVEFFVLELLPGTVNYFIFNLLS